MGFAHTQRRRLLLLAGMVGTADDVNSALAVGCRQTQHQPRGPGRWNPVIACLAPPCRHRATASRPRPAVGSSRPHGCPRESDCSFWLHLMQAEGSPAPKLLLTHLLSAEPVAEGGFQLAGLPITFERVWLQVRCSLQGVPQLAVRCRFVSCPLLSRLREVVPAARLCSCRRRARCGPRWDRCSSLTTAPAPPTCCLG